ncbi:Lysine exporter LysO [bioreactor metagenome]|uniref:Lysine exporter LysO n=1 Tax=bioreactor metagenome TaxID=1076179 RepID=A0A644SXV8_9ZZZZ|nr:lysine exporter LysO family protein [Negativicutes bacterium]
MVYLIIGAVLVGILTGLYIVPAAAAQLLDTIVTWALALMVFGVGIEIGRNRKAFHGLKALGWRVLLVPFAIAAGSLIGAAGATVVLDMPLKEVMAVGAGLGWYSLSGVLIAQLYSVELGAIAFLANVFREMLAFILIPVLVGYVGKLAAIAPGGATTMDSTLPLITKVTDSQTALIAVMSGFVLTAFIPFLIPFLLAL